MECNDRIKLSTQQCEDVADGDIKGYKSSPLKANLVYFLGREDVADGNIKAHESSPITAT